MSAFLEERVLSVHHWTDRLFSFTTTRDPALRFSSGHFTMIGLKVDGKNLLRAYSIASPNYEEHLEFLSIKVDNGPLTSKLQHIQVGDTIIVGKKPTGTLLVDYLLPGKNLYLIGTGTGLAPWLAVAREPFRNQGRISNQINAGTFPQNIGLPELNPDTDRVMLCGSPAMLAELKELLESRGFKEGNTSTPGDFVVERAFVEK